VSCSSRLLESQCFRVTAAEHTGTFRFSLQLACKPQGFARFSVFNRARGVSKRKGMSKAFTRKTAICQRVTLPAGSNGRRRSLR